jgi:chromosomal replication initiation ATPase DnaA
MPIFLLGKMSTDSDFIGLLRNIYRVVRRHGVKVVEEKLRQMESFGIDDYETKVIDRIIEECCRAFRVERSELVDGKKRGIYASARKVAFVVMKETLSLSETQISFFFKRHNKVVYRAIQEWEMMDPTHPSDREMLGKKQVVSAAVTKFIEECRKK